MLFAKYTVFLIYSYMALKKKKKDKKTSPVQAYKPVKRGKRTEKHPVVQRRPKCGEGHTSNTKNSNLTGKNNRNGRERISHVKLETWL